MQAGGNKSSFGFRVSAYYPGESGLEKARPTPFSLLRDDGMYGVLCKMVERA